MATEYTEDQLLTFIQDIDTELRKLLLSSQSGGPSLRLPLDYSLGEKRFNLTSRVEALLKLRKTYVDYLMATGAGINEIPIPPDYDMTDLGEQLGDEITGNE